jgi:hypothetical protein
MNNNKTHKKGTLGKHGLKTTKQPTNNKLSKKPYYPTPTTIKFPHSTSISISKNNRSKKSSPGSIKMDQVDTNFCVACTTTRVIVYAIIKYYSLSDELTLQDTMMLMSFYYYRQIKNAPKESGISYEWLTLFVRELNANSMNLITDREGNSSLFMGPIPSVDNKVFKQGDYPDLNEKFDSDMLATVEIDINRLYHILNRSAENMNNRGINLEMITINKPTVDKFTQETCTNSMISLISPESSPNWDRLTRMNRQGDVTFITPSNKGEPLSGHELFVRTIEGSVLSIVNSWSGSHGPPAISVSGVNTNYVYYTLTDESVKFVHDITYLKEVSVEVSVAKGVKSRRRYKNKKNKTRHRRM